MSGRLDDIPVFERKQTTVPAADFNLVQIALNRLGEPLHIPLTVLRSLELILERESWIVVDRDLNDIPILAWTDFQSGGRTTLHAPIPCQLKTYHLHAPVILEQVTAFMEQELETRLSELQKACEIENVVPLKKQ
jgi:hypothetical protein